MVLCQSSPASLQRKPHALCIGDGVGKRGVAHIEEERRQEGSGEARETEEGEKEGAQVL